MAWLLFVFFFVLFFLLIAVRGSELLLALVAQLAVFGMYGTFGHKMDGGAYLLSCFLVFFF
ncbi:hypothetical protein FN846DRAFT_590013 [Sphaerosporella brunnea]|uniref:Uncharacterized protein n=1 Tax=Sphaerosporella brunnea TaxID=1250544 RepID=A0A5J5EDZ6_9PEZI|nr:hypothetical protein FN846DRAFT_590013 [Sphaerosporella brunnea]